MSQTQSLGVGNRFHEESIWKILEREGYYHNALKKILNGWVGVDGNCPVTFMTGIIIIVYLLVLLSERLC